MCGSADGKQNGHPDPRSNPHTTLAPTVYSPLSAARAKRAAIDNLYNHQYKKGCKTL